MHIVTVVAIVGTNPIKTIKLLLNSLDEVLTGNNRIGYLSDLKSRISVDVDVLLLLNGPCI